MAHDRFIYGRRAAAAGPGRLQLGCYLLLHGRAGMVRHRRLSHTLWPMGIIKCTCNGNGVLFEMDTLNVYGDGPHTHPKHDFRIAPHFRYFFGGLIFPYIYIYICMGKCMGNRYHLRSDTSAARVGRAARPARGGAHSAAPIRTQARARAR